MIINSVISSGGPDLPPVSSITGFILPKVPSTKGGIFGRMLNFNGKLAIVGRDSTSWGASGTSFPDPKLYILDDTGWTAYDLPTDTYTINTTSFRYYDGPVGYTAPAIVFGGVLYVGGGLGRYSVEGGFAQCGHNGFFKYNETANTWTKLANIPYAYWDQEGMGNGFVEYNGNLYLLGSYTHRYFHRYNVSNNTWTAMTAQPSECPYSPGACFVYNNKIYSIRSNNGGGTQTIYVWNGSTWSTITTTLFPNSNALYIPSSDGIHVIGCGAAGGIPSYANAQSQAYQPIHYLWDGANTFTNLGNLDGVYVGQQNLGVISGGYLYVGGGHDSNKAAINSFYISKL